MTQRQIGNLGLRCTTEPLFAIPVRRRGRLLSFLFLKQDVICCADAGNLRYYKPILPGLAVLCWPRRVVPRVVGG